MTGFLGFFYGQFSLFSNSKVFLMSCVEVLWSTFIWFTGGLCSAGLTVGLDGLKKLFQPKWLYGSMISNIRTSWLVILWLVWYSATQIKVSINTWNSIFSLKKWQHKLYFSLFLSLVFSLWDILLAFSLRKLWEKLIPDKWFRVLLLLGKTYNREGEKPRRLAVHLITNFNHSNGTQSACPGQ